MSQIPFEGYDFEKIKKEFNAVLSEVFDKDIEYAFFSGSVAYGGGIVKKSDIDIAIVLKEKEYSLSKFIDFGKHYIEINKKNNFVPDVTFPGEFLTPLLVSDAISGRGFSVKDNILYLPIASTEYYLADPERWFRAWLSMLTFSVFVTGSVSKFEEAKRNAWRTVLLFLFSTPQFRVVSLSDLTDMLSNGDNKWLGFGVTKNYCLFRDYETKIIKNTLVGLIQEGFIEESGGFYRPVRKAINMWNYSVVQKIKDKSIRKANFLIDLDNTNKISNSFNVGRIGT